MSNNKLNPFDNTGAPTANKFEYACTVVSLLPYRLKEDKPHLLPSTYVIEPAPKDGFSVTYIKEAMHYIANPLIDEGKPGSSIRQITTPMEMARSIVDDYTGAHVATDEDAKPGLFWVEGRLSHKEVIEHYSEQLAEARRKQNNWFINLVAMADADWQRNKNILTVSSLQQIAAKALGEDKEWMHYVQVAEKTIKCPFCKTSIDPSSVKCINCNEVVDTAAYKKLTEGVSA